MDIAELKAEKRDQSGKGLAKKLRANGKIPAVVYGNKVKPMSIAIDAREFETVRRGEAGAHVIKLLISGERTKPTALVKEAQLDKVRGSYVHIDFQRVAMDQDITASLPVAAVGEAPGVKLGGILEHHLWEVEVEGKPADLPPQLEADISKMQVGESLYVRDLALPSGITAVTDSEELILSILAPKVEVSEVSAEEVEAAEAQVVRESGEAAE